jgi:hypothetical protein
LFTYGSNQGISYIYKLDLVGVQEVSWDIEGTVRVGDYNFFHVKKIETIKWAQGFLYITEKYQHLREQSLLAIRCNL